VSEHVKKRRKKLLKCIRESKHVMKKRGKTREKNINRLGGDSNQSPY